MKLYVFSQGDSAFGIYLSKKDYEFENVEDLRYVDFTNNFYKDILCFAIVYLDEEILNLNWISTNPSSYNMGFATRLINKIYDIGKNLDKKYIMLDDCSGILPPRNIYYKLGFQVKHEGHWVNWDKDYNVDEERRKIIILDQEA